MGLREPLLETAIPVHASEALLIAIGRPAPWVFLSRVRGHLDVVGARVIDQAVRAQTAAEKRYMILLNDWSGMTDYDGAARVLLTDLARAVLPACEAVHILLSSQRVAFGVRAANLVLHRLTAHTRPQTFAAALQAAVEQQPRLRMGA
jgi:hypothetical protein